jgi:DnaK suppressor protein
MDEETTRRFKLLLELEKSRILGNAKASLDELSEKTTETTGDEGDQAQSMAEQHLSLRFKERERNHLRKIEAALDKIKEGTFGECEDCGDEIGVKRLEIRPVATLCISCKEAEEKREKSYDSSTG